MQQVLQFNHDNTRLESQSSAIHQRQCRVEDYLIQPQQPFQLDPNVSKLESHLLVRDDLTNLATSTWSWRIFNSVVMTSPIRPMTMPS